MSYDINPSSVTVSSSQDLADEIGVLEHDIIASLGPINTVATPASADLNYFVSSDDSGDTITLKDVLGNVEVKLNDAAPADFRVTNADLIDDMFPTLSTLHLHCGSESAADSITEYHVTDKSSLIEALIRFVFFKNHTSFDKETSKGLESDFYNNYPTMLSDTSIATAYEDAKTTIRNSITVNETINVNSSGIKALLAEIFTDILNKALHADSDFKTAIESNIDTFMAFDLSIDYVLRYQLSFKINSLLASGATVSDTVTCLFQNLISIAE